MDLEKLQNIDLQWIDSVWQEAKAEFLYEAFLKSRDLSEWVRYLEAYPPSPEALAIALCLGAEKYEERKKATLAKAGAAGAKRKHTPTDELKAWAEQKAANMRETDRDIARKLAFNIPPELASKPNGEPVSKDPVKLIYEHLRAIRKARKASQP
jgi:hypothetical protein